MIIHFSTVHPRDDSRIRSKEMASLAQAFGAVALYVQDGLGDEVDAVHHYPIVDTGPRLPRFKRMFLGGWRMFRAVLKAQPQVAHFHDPELLPWAILLRILGVRIVYDVHEDVPEQVKHNPTLPRWAHLAVPPLVAVAEWIGSHVFDGLVVTTQTIADRFPAEKTILVRNFPILDELYRSHATPHAERAPHFAYVGYISELRNIFGMMQAMALLPERRAHIARRIAGRALDLDDIRPQIRQHLRGIGAENNGRQVDDADAFKHLHGNGCPC